MSQVLPPAARAQDPLIGRVLDGRYRVESLVARGGMATVYRGADTRLDRTVAIKVMHPSFATDAGFVARFDREARAAARLNTPYVVAVHDQGTDQGVTFLVMEYVPGHTVRDVLRVHRALDPAAALAIIDPVLQALAAAHRAGYIHRDIKPENVLISDDGQVKVTDFGLARAIEGSDSGKTHGLLLGTVAYLSPEHVDQAHTDARSDVYSAGILLYELLTGTVPFSAAAPLQVAYRHVHEDVPAPSSVRPELPAAIDELVVRATRRPPDQRYPDAAAFLAAVRRVREELPASPAWRPAPTDTLVVATNDGPAVRWDPDSSAPQRPAEAAPAQPAAAEPAAAPPASGTGRDQAQDPPGSLDLWDEPESLWDELAADRWDSPAEPTPPPPIDDAHTQVQRGTTPQAQPPAKRGRFTRRSQRAAAAPVAKPPRKPRRTARVITGVVALACVLGLLAFLFGPLQRVTVPAVAGHTVKEATAMLAAANLKLDAAAKDYSETVPKGQIISSDPNGGQTARTGTTVTAIISRGPERYDVPSLSGVTPAEAEVALKATKLALGKVTDEYHDTVPAGQIITTDPQQGTSVKPGTKVALTVSQGPKPVDLPKLVGTNAEQTAKTLRDLGLKVSISKKTSETVPAGNIISTDPKGETTVPHGSTVKIVESKGPPMVTVPNVVGKNRTEATAALEAAGFKVRVEYPLIFGTFDRVHSQNPKGGTSLAKGSTVTIEVV